METRVKFIEDKGNRIVVFVDTLERDKYTCYSATFDEYFDATPTWIKSKKIIRDNFADIELVLERRGYENIEVIGRFSLNRKLNHVLTEIYNYIYYSIDINELKRYKNEFPNEIDYNLYQYGLLLIGDNEIRDLYKEYKRVPPMERLIEVYKRQVRYITNLILKEYENK